MAFFPAFSAETSTGTAAKKPQQAQIAGIRCRESGRSEAKKPSATSVGLSIDRNRRFHLRTAWCRHLSVHGRFEAKPLVNHVQRPALHLAIDSAYVFAHYTKASKRHAGQEENADEQQRRTRGPIISKQSQEQRIKNSQHGDRRGDKTDQHGNSQRNDRE